MILPAMPDNIIFEAYESYRVNINGEHYEISPDCDVTDKLIPVVELMRMGFRPIAISWQMCETTFIFNTDQEAGEVYERFEVGRERTVNGEIIQGWFYSFDRYMKNLDDVDEWGWGKRHIFFTEFASKNQTELITERNNKIHE